MALILTNVIPGHDLEQHSRSFSRQLVILHNANAGGTVTFEPYNSKSAQ